MHLLENFALNSGSKIDKPYIYDTYIPLQWDTDKYITFQPWGTQRFDSRKYSYWEEVLDILRPIFNKENIHIVQIGQANEPQVKGTMSMSGKTTINQAAYLIKNSMLHLGVDSFGVHFASGFEKKIVALYSNMTPELSGPYWSKPEDIRLISSLEKGESPSYSMVEDPKTIDRIKAEFIAKQVCELLNLEFTYDFETVYTGKEYAQKRIEVVPTNHIGNWQDFNVDSLILRMDKHFNEGVCASQLEKCRCSIVSDKPIRLDLLNFYKDKIVETVFVIKDDQNIEYLNQAKSMGIKLFLISHLPEEELNKIKLKYIDVGQILSSPHPSKEKFFEDNPQLNIKDLYYKSGCTVIREKNLYGTYSPTEKAPINYSDREPQKLEDCPDLWKDLERLLILKKKTS